MVREDHEDLVLRVQSALHLEHEHRVPVDVNAGSLEGNIDALSKHHRVSVV